MAKISLEPYENGWQGWVSGYNAFTLYLLRDGTFQLFPPPGWIVRLVELQLNGIISNASARIVLDEWFKKFTPIAERFLNLLQSHA